MPMIQPIEPAPPAVAIRGLAKTYRGRKKKPVSALRDLEFSVAKGEILGLLGPNGAGKTTAVKLIMGFVRADKGEVLFNGIPQEFASPRPHTGYLPENFKPNPHLTVREYMYFHYGLSGIFGKKAGQGTMDLLEKVGMAPFADRRIKDLSKGMGQRVGLAQAFVGDPDILILDEPTSGLDPVGRSEVIDFLLEQKRAGKSIFFCSHILSEVQRVCDRIGILVSGQLRCLNTLGGLLEQSQNPDLETAFKKEVLCQQS